MSALQTLKARSGLGILWIVVRNLILRRPMVILTLVRGETFELRCPVCDEPVLIGERT